MLLQNQVLYLFNCMLQNYKILFEFGTKSIFSIGQKIQGIGEGG